MTSQTLPIMLQDSQTKLQALRQPHVPYRENTVKDSESALEGESFWAIVLCAIMPWWADMFLSGGGSDENSEKDYLIGTPLALIVMAVTLSVATDMEWWNIFAFSMITAAVTFLALILFHLIFHKCITMYIYNHVFRRSWMRKMHAMDEKKYLADVEAYPQLLKDYELAKKSANYDANIALAAYNASNPSDTYKIGEYGFEEVSFLDKSLNLAGEQVRGLFKKFKSKLPASS